MEELRGRVAAITGAASGIGRALAIRLADSGCDLALCDVDEVGLAHTVELVGGRVKVTSRAIDVADRTQVFGWADEVVSGHGGVNLIVNNAGVNVVANASVQSIDDFEWLMNTNFWGVVHGTQAFLPYLRTSGEGHVVNMSSVFGLMSIPSQSAYNASKFAVRGYSDALRMELEMEGAPVAVTTVHPGGVKTAIARNARVDQPSAERVDKDAEFADRFEQVAFTTPEKAARQIVRAIQRDRRRALIGPDAILFDLVSRLPALFTQRITMKATRQTMGSALPKT